MPDAPKRNEVDMAVPFSGEGFTVVLLNYKVLLSILDHHRTATALTKECYQPHTYVSLYVLGRTKANFST